MLFYNGKDYVKENESWQQKHDNDKITFLPQEINLDSWFGYPKF